jgi:ComF family protein
MDLAGLRRFARRVWLGLLDVVYPPRCLHCNARTPTARIPLCSRCVQRPERAAPDQVVRHIERLPAPTDALDAATALWRFDKDGALQQVQHGLKYGNRPYYGIEMGRLMAACVDALHESPTAIVPIPLHRTRQYERGYNQSTMLARGLSGALDVPVQTGWLTRPVATRSQAHLPRAERWTNVASAFEANRSAPIAGASILLVDDVITTGSTAVAAAAALKDAGAARVVLCALAFARD